MAEETVDAAIKEYNLKPTGPSQTAHIKLLGAHAWTKTMYIKLIQQFGLETEVAKHLAESYGDQAWTVASMSDSTGMSTLIPSTRERQTDIQDNHGHCTEPDSPHYTPTSRLNADTPFDTNMP